MKASHVSALKRRINKGLNGNPARAKCSKIRNALRSERSALFAIGKGSTPHNEYCLTCMLDCEVLRRIDNSYAASLKRTGGDDRMKQRENAVNKDMMERGDKAVLTFETCPKVHTKRRKEDTT
jgi:hypothetical protein